jgi:hypothetical protein
MLKNVSEITLEPKKKKILKILNFVQSFVECKVGLADGTRAGLRRKCSNDGISRATWALLLALPRTSERTFLCTVTRTILEIEKKKKRLRHATKGTKESWAKDGVKREIGDGRADNGR